MRPAIRSPNQIAQSVHCPESNSKDTCGGALKPHPFGREPRGFEIWKFFPPQRLLCGNFILFQCSNPNQQCKRKATDSSSFESMVCLVGYLTLKELPVYRQYKTWWSYQDHQLTDQTLEFLDDHVWTLLATLQMNQLIHWWKKSENPSISESSAW